MKKFISLLLTVMVLMSCVISVSAEDGTVTIKTKDIEFGPGSSYTDTDLFDNFKGVMPGDTLTQKIVIKNDLTKYDYVKVYLRAVPHGASNTPETKDLSAADSKAFLDNMTMTVKTAKGKTIYSGKPWSASDGLEEKVLVATINKKKTSSLTAELVVPIEMDETYMNKMGEVDWEFTVEGFNNSSSGGNGNYKTGDIIMICVLVMILALAALALLFYMKKRKKK